MSIRSSRPSRRAAQPSPEVVADALPEVSQPDPARESPRIVRSQISHEMAFPVGHELLQAHFSAAPRWPEATFYFDAYPTTFASEFTRILRDQERFQILRLEHGVRHREQIAHWIFTVYPVPRKLKSIARAALIAQSFPALHDFMSRCPSHRNYYNRCTVIFDPVEGTCSVEQLWEF